MKHVLALVNQHDEMATYSPEQHQEDIHIDNAHKLHIREQVEKH